MKDYQKPEIELITLTTLEAVTAEGDQEVVSSPF